MSLIACVSLRPAASPSTATDEIDDLDRISLANRRRPVAIAFQDREIVLDRHTARIDLEPIEQLQHGQRPFGLERIAVQSDLQILLHGVATPMRLRMASTRLL